MENNSINSLNINIEIDKNIGIDINSSTGPLKRPQKGNFSSSLPVKSGSQNLTCSAEHLRNPSGQFRLKILNIAFKTYLINFKPPTFFTFSENFKENFTSLYLQIIKNSTLVSSNFYNYESTFWVKKGY